jgi:BTB/POZ domain
VSVFVGDSSSPLILPKALLCHESEFFRAAFAGQFDEARSGIITLRDEEPEIFVELLKWFYGSKTLSITTCKVGDTELKQREARRGYLLMIKLYVLADKLVVKPLADQILATILEPFNKLQWDTSKNPSRMLIIYPGKKAVLYAYRYSIPGSRLRRAIAKQAAMKITGLKDTDDGHRLNFYDGVMIKEPEFATDVVHYLVRGNSHGLALWGLL